MLGMVNRFPFCILMHNAVCLMSSGNLALVCAGLGRAFRQYSLSSLFFSQKKKKNLIHLNNAVLMVGVLL